MRRAVVPLLLAGAALAMAAGPAHAALNLCNRTSYILYAATAVQAPGGNTLVTGWTRITPGECVAARAEKLAPRKTYLVHARTGIAHSGPPRAWGGRHGLCVRDDNFTLNQAAPGKDCPAGSFALGFAEIGTRGLADWTMTFDEQPPIAGLQAAQLAGVRRLLKDNGYKVGPITGGPDKATGAALAAFRKTMNAADAGNAALFAALEKGARGRVAPAGLTACNDGKAALLVALGQAGHGKQAARGWWTVAPGACARLQTIPLAADKMYVLAQTADGAVVKGGPHRFCTSGGAFEIAGAQGCGARGYDEAGFAPVDAHGAAGVILHLGGR